MKKYIVRIAILGLFLLSTFGCEGKENPPEAEVGVLVPDETYPEAGAENITPGDLEIVLTFPENIKLDRSVSITVNDKAPEKIAPDLQKLRIRVRTEAGADYKLILPAGAVEGRETGSLSPEWMLSFSTRKILSENLVVKNPSPEAQKVFGFLNDQFESKIVTGTMANVSWDTKEADWVYTHTGYYPALNGFDFIHLHASPSGWIDYGKIGPVESWWEEGGLVSAMWHWNVPVEKDSDAFQFYTRETDFDITKAVIPGTDEYEIIRADLEKISEYLLLLKEKGIPILWRPLHEAAGGWFWWGAKGPEPCRQLWKMMFEKFEEKGLNNLIWVWTSETGDEMWYPGDEYVDIVGRDAYEISSAQRLAAEFQELKEVFPGKIVALSEFGGLPELSVQWEAGARWSWMMPWYDYDRTIHPGSETFQETSHAFADIEYWRAVFEMEAAIRRDQLPDWNSTEE